MTALKMPHFLSVEDYLVGELASEVKHEYIDGVVHAMAGATNIHNIISGNTFASLYSQLRGKRCQAFNGDTKIRVSYPNHTRFYYPDAMVVCQPNPGTDSCQDFPVVVVEVLSDSTRRTDLTEKREAYLTISSLKVLIFLEQESAGAIVHRRRADGGFAIEHHQGLDAVIPLPEIDGELQLAELYERVDFPVR